VHVSAESRDATGSDKDVHSLGAQLRECWTPFDRRFTALGVQHVTGAALGEARGCGLFRESGGQQMSIHGR